MSQTKYLSQSSVQDFLSARKRSSTLIAIGVMLCIFSPITLLILISLTRLDILTSSINFATEIGVIVLILLAAAAVALFIAGNHWLKVNENYEYEDCNLSEELHKKILKESRDYENKHYIFKIIGIAFCILSAIPLMSGALFTDALSNSRLDDFMTGLSSITIFLVGIGVFFLVKTNIVHDSFNIILQIDDYTTEKKAGKKVIEKYTSIYWMIIAFIYLTYSFLSNNWQQSWIIWPLAGIAYGILEAILSFKKKINFRIIYQKKRPCVRKMILLHSRYQNIYISS